MRLCWWAIPRISRTQDFLAGDDFGCVLEVEIQRDPVVEDVDRVHECIDDLPLVGGAVHVAVPELLEPEHLACMDSSGSLSPRQKPQNPGFEPLRTCTPNLHPL